MSPSSLTQPRPASVSRPPPATETAAPVAQPALPILRFTVFTLANFGVVFGIWELTRRMNTHPFTEGSPLEWVQFGTLLVVAGLFGFFAARRPEHRALAVLLGTAAGLGAIREMDAYLDLWLPFGWTLPFWLLAAGSAVFLWIRRAELVVQLKGFVASRAFGILWCAIILAVPFGQMIGHGSFLKTLLGDDYRRPVKRVIEESAETMGYLWVLLGSTDWLLEQRRRAGKTSSAPKL